jgi:hypothetical protein
MTEYSDMNGQEESGFIRSAERHILLDCLHLEALASVKTVMRKTPLLQCILRKGVRRKGIEARRVRAKSLLCHLRAMWASSRSRAECA